CRHAARRRQRRAGAARRTAHQGAAGTRATASVNTGWIALRAQVLHTATRQLASWGHLATCPCRSPKKNGGVTVPTWRQFLSPRRQHFATAHAAEASPSFVGGRRLLETVPRLLAAISRAGSRMNCLSRASGGVV